MEVEEFMIEKKGKRGSLILGIYLTISISRSDININFFN